MTTDSDAIGILYSGEMGAAVAALLRSNGRRVVTVLDGRSADTARRANAVGMEIAADLVSFVRSARIVFSFVSPAAAMELALQYCIHAGRAPNGAIYVEANSIGPDLAASISQTVESAGVSCVDAAINGLARNLTTGATLMLSGARAAEIASLFPTPVPSESKPITELRVRVLGPRIGMASAMKMLLSGLSKGVCALYLETALAAEQFGMLAEMNDAYSMIYPGIMALIERMLPTYSLHAGRRADEMRQLEQTLHSAGLQPPVVAAIRESHELLSQVQFPSEIAIADVSNFVKTLAAGAFMKQKHD